MNYSTIKKCDIANGAGVRTSLFVSGCRRHCPVCFNASTWPFDAGQPFTRAVEDDIIQSSVPYYISGLSLLGGEPMEPENMPALLAFVRRFRDALPSKNVWCYTGFTWEELMARQDDVTRALLMEIDVLVDGAFIEAEKDIRLRFRGSRNQRIILVQSSLSAGEVRELRTVG